MLARRLPGTPRRAHRRQRRGDPGFRRARRTRVSRDDGRCRRRRGALCPDFRVLESAHPRGNAACSIPRPASTCRCKCCSWTETRQANTSGAQHYRLSADGGGRPMQIDLWYTPARDGSRSNPARPTGGACATRRNRAVRHATAGPSPWECSRYSADVNLRMRRSRSRPASSSRASWATWYVIANIPTSIERDALQCRRVVQARRDGTIETTFSFREGGFDGPVKRYCPRGFVRDTSSNAVWGMRSSGRSSPTTASSTSIENYQRTIVGREKRDNVWIMARTPQIADADLRRAAAMVGREGYDMRKLASRAAAVAGERERTAAQRRGGCP